MNLFKSCCMSLMMSLCATAICNAEFYNLLSGDTYDLGNIASDGSAGLQFVVRPQRDSDVGKDWEYFSDTRLENGQIVFAPPSTPAQSAFNLQARMPLIVAIPQLAHFPELESVTVTPSIVGNDITNKLLGRHVTASEMRSGQPIFDSYVNPSTGQQIPTGGFLNAERNLLESRGWQINPLSGAYHPPGS